MAMTVISHGVGSHEGQGVRWLSHMASVSETGSHKALRYLGVTTIWHCKHAKCTFTQKVGILGALYKAITKFTRTVYELNRKYTLFLIPRGECNRIV